MTAWPLINDGKEFQMYEIEAVRVMDDEFWPILPADESREKSFRQTRQHLTGRAGVQPAGWEIKLGANLIDNRPESGRQGTGAISCGVAR